MDENLQKIIACSSCFKDEGLKLDAYRLGNKIDSVCPNCNKTDGVKLNGYLLSELAQHFFVQGSVFKSHYGAANAIQFNEHHFNKDDIDVPEWLKDDMKLIGQLLKIGFFHYGPRLWRLGNIEPLVQLQSKDDRSIIIEEILNHYPNILLPRNTSFYRLRKNPQNPVDVNEYDSPPDEFLGSGRLDSKLLPILYGSQDLEVCVHECRVTIEDELYLCTLDLIDDLNVLNLTEWIKEEKTEFESLNMAIHMLFRAPDHSYEIIREIAIAAAKKGFDGLIYPSYYSQIHAKKETIGNLALFGKPIKDGRVRVRCVNRLLLNRVSYDIQFGPAKF